MSGPLSGAPGQLWLDVSEMVVMPTSALIFLSPYRVFVQIVFQHNNMVEVWAGGLDILRMYLYRLALIVHNINIFIKIVFIPIKPK